MSITVTRRPIEFHGFDELAWNDLRGLGKHRSSLRMAHPSPLIRPEAKS